MLDRTLAVSYFPCILRSLQLGQGRPQLGPQLDPQGGGDLVASEQRRRRSLPPPVEAGGDQLAGKPNGKGLGARDFAWSALIAELADPPPADYLYL